MPYGRTATERLGHKLNLYPDTWYERVTHRTARRCVNNKVTFLGSNIFGRWEDEFIDIRLPVVKASSSRLARYVVYSYGTHFPIYIYELESAQWYGNKDKYSRTTSRHQSCCHPDGVRILWLDTEKMQRIAMYGVFNTVVYAATGGL